MIAYFYVWRKQIGTDGMFWDIEGEINENRKLYIR